MQSVDDLRNGVCPAGRKACEDDGVMTCVPLSIPRFGCASNSCQPCFRQNAVMRCNERNECAFSTCKAPYVDCDGDINAELSNGCEVDSDSDAEHCGSSCTSCDLKNTSRNICYYGVCVPGLCVANYADCDKIAANGCEANLLTSTQHCGGCNQPCSSAGGCVEGVCAP